MIGVGPFFTLPWRSNSFLYIPISCIVIFCFILNCCLELFTLVTLFTTYLRFQTRSSYQINLLLFHVISVIFFAYFIHLVSILSIIFLSLIFKSFYKQIWVFWFVFVQYLTIFHSISTFRNKPINSIKFFPASKKKYRLLI